MKLVNSYTGEAVTVYLFVACLTYSRFAYVEPTLDMKMDTWIRCHVHMSVRKPAGICTGQNISGCQICWKS